jgi:hypothetical protein
MVWYVVAGLTVMVVAAVAVESAIKDWTKNASALAGCEKECRLVIAFKKYYNPADARLIPHRQK